MSVDFDLLKGWIEACDKMHGNTCVPALIQNRPDEQIPDWLIDVENSCIVEGRCANRYVALSYVWAGNQGPEHAKLVNDNLTALREPGSLGKVAIAQVVKETMDLLRNVGERYLWVDALCNIQDGEQIRKQVDRMNFVYSGAYFTVIAATSAPGLYGILPPVERKGSREQDTGGEFDDLSDAQERDEIEDHYKRLFGSDWNRRGWTFQEQILSRRAITFVDGGPWFGKEVDVYWDCQRSVWDGVALTPQRELATRNNSSTAQTKSPFREMARRMFSTPWPNFRVYMELVCPYNYRELTNAEDVLPAFTGILNSLGPSFPGGFVGGLPRLFIDEALLWQPLTRATRRSVSDGRKVTSLFPSWSWCGWECFVDPSSFRAGLAYLADKDNVSQASSWRTRRLVEWSLVSSGEVLRESILLDEYKRHQTDKALALPAGWSRNPSGGDDTSYFTHVSDPKARFRHPVPLTENIAPPSAQLAPIKQIPSGPLLSCDTTRVFLRIHSVLEPSGWAAALAGLHMSIFDHPKVVEGPDYDEICDILCLQDKKGRGAGFLRLMGSSQETKAIKSLAGSQIELIAISMGSASVEDLGATFEEHVNSKRWRDYRQGNTRVYFGRSPGGTVRMKLWRWWEGRSGGKESGNAREFYNVLWVERKDGIAYRRAAGRVPKRIWEDASPETVCVVLG